MLGTLANYGGPTQTLALLAGSPAIGAGNASATVPATDQRGLPRVVNGSLDIGAFQTQPPTLAFTTLGQTADAGQPTGSITVELEDPDGNPAPAGSVSYSGNGTTADTTGGSNLTLVGGAGFAAGQTGQALSLNGANQYAITPNLASLFANSDASVTVSLWFNATGPGVIMDELGQTALNTGWHDSQIEILANGTVEVRVWDLSAVTLGTASFNAWHNVVLRYNAATQTLDGFLDGVQSTSSTSGGRSTPYGSGYGLYYAFGATDTTNLGSGACFNGLIQYISIFNRPLSNAEVQTLYGGGSGVTVTRHAEQQLHRRQLLVSQRPAHQRRANRHPAGGEQCHFRLHRHPAGNAHADGLRRRLRLGDAAGNHPAGADLGHAQHRHRRRPDALRLFHGRRAEQPGNHHLHGLQPASRLDDRRAADRYAGAGRDAGERVAAAGPERAEPGLEPGHDRGGLLDQREHHGVAGEFQHLAVGHGRPGFRHAQRRPDLEFHARRHAHARAASIPTCWPRRPTPNTTDPYIQEEAAVLDYNAQNIFNFLHNDIGYNSYIGSLRGAAARSGPTPATPWTWPAWAWP